MSDNPAEPVQLSYEEIIECIQEDKAVPNMVQVPDIVHSSENISESTLPMRRKPWETKAEDDTKDVDNAAEAPQ